MSKELDVEYIKERASEMNFVVLWLEKHTEYLKGYPDTLPYIDSRKWSDGVRNYPLIDCAKAERDDLWISYSAALALEMYLAGTRDGGRIYHAFVTGELPTIQKHKEPPNEDTDT